ncbi:MAG TPA: succinate dehydrogenase, cytochrome b556 subunit [Anaerolineaceae bacterium]
MSTSSMKTTFNGYVRYRGKEGQWSFLLHRITGLGVLLFLLIHILDTATVYFLPNLYNEVINIYRSTVFGVLEIGLIFCLFFHGVNGIRIAYLDVIKPTEWTPESERRSSLIALIITLVFFLPSAVFMLRNLIINNFGG